MDTNYVPTPFVRFAYFFIFIFIFFLKIFIVGHHTNLRRFNNDAASFITRYKRNAWYMSPYLLEDEEDEEEEEEEEEEE